ncbi:MAG TPA: site-2 protease family protein [Tepidisphaeraceae bacterium]|jgi:Zn-dependent protease
MTVPVVSATCPRCAAELAPALLACPGCGSLVHADRLQGLADGARAAADRGDVPAALSAWREVLDLLPAGSRQHQVVRQKIVALTEGLPSGPPPQRAASTAAAPSAPGQPTGTSSAGKKAAAGLGALGLLLLKFKTFLLLLVTKGKLLLWGLTKGTTLLSMLASFGVYWAIWGWRFGLGLVLSIYVHEMGHVIALRRFGFKATSPMFIPALGAFIRMRQAVIDPRESAAIGLAGPIYGLGAAAVAAALWYATKHPLLAALAGVGAWINLFNLLPIGTLDGGRAFHALSRPQRVLAACAVGAAWFITKDGLLLLLLIVCGARCLERGDQRGDSRACAHYAALILLLSVLSMVRIYARIGH